MKKIIKSLSLVIILIILLFFNAPHLFGVSESEFSEIKSTIVKTCIKQVQKTKTKNIDISGFKAKDLNGNVVTSDIFSKNKLTMVNIWATWCGFCVDEMPEINKLYKNLPEGTNIISICTDANESNESLNIAKEIMKKSNVEFITLIPDETLKKKLTDNIQIFPTTVFVDNKGNTVGNPNSEENTAEGYMKSIKDHLKLIK